MILLRIGTSINASDPTLPPGKITASYGAFFIASWSDTSGFIITPRDKTVHPSPSSPATVTSTCFHNFT